MSIITRVDMFIEFSLRINDNYRDSNGLGSILELFKGIFRC